MSWMSWLRWIPGVGLARRGARQVWNDERVERWAMIAELWRQVRAPRPVAERVSIEAQIATGGLTEADLQRLRSLFAGRAWLGFGLAGVGFIAGAANLAHPSGVATAALLSIAAAAYGLGNAYQAACISQRRQLRFGEFIGSPSRWFPNGG